MLRFEHRDGVVGLDAFPPPPATGREVAAWAGRALTKGRAAEALAAWEAAGSPGTGEAAVAVAIALLEAETDRWASARARTTGVTTQAPDNLLAVGLAALGAYHEGAPAEAAALFESQGLFAAYPLVRLFLRTFALETMRSRDRSRAEEETTTASSGEASGVAGIESSGPANGESSGEAGIESSRVANGESSGVAGNESSREANGESSRVASGEANAAAVPGREANTPERPGLWRRFVRGGGFGRDSTARAWVVEGDRWLLRGDPARALACFEAAGREDPGNWMARMAEALCRLETGDVERAGDDLLALLGEHPDVPNVASAAAWASLHRGRAREALEIVATLAPAGPDDWGIYYISALAFLDLDRPDESDLMLREALGPFFLDTWENFVMPLFHRVVEELRAQAAAEGGPKP